MVEDNEDVRRIGARFLADLGYRVYQAGNADRALELLAAHPDIQLLFTDIVLPGRYGGKELAEEARRRRPELGNRRGPSRGELRWPAEHIPQRRR